MKQLRRRLSEDRPSSKYTVIRKLGAGAFGTVYLAKKKVDGELVAIKEIKNVNADTAEEVLEEIKILKELNCPKNIVCYDTAFYYDNTVYLVTEYVKGKDLRETIRSVKKRYNGTRADTIILNMLKELLDVLAFLEKKKIIHADIKPENIIVNEQNHPILLDFGIACLESYRCTPRGTIGYIAPEVFMLDRLFLVSDVWSLGMSFYRSMLIHPLYPSNYKEKDIVKSTAENKYLRYPIPTSNTTLKTTLRKMLIYNYRERPTALTLKS